MMFRLLLLACFLLAAGAQGQIVLDDRVSLHFATVDEAKSVLTTRDDYIRRLSPFDRAAKIQSGAEVSDEDYLAAISANILPWAPPEREQVTDAIALLQESLSELKLPLPPRILLIRTNGNDEGGAPYTRGHAIVLPDPNLQRSPELISRILCHELFHILSRANPALREKLYGLIGFEKCGEVMLPPDLRSRKITNPDAPIVEHAVRIEAQGVDAWVAPVLYSNESRFDPKAGGNFFRYLQFRLLTVNHRQGAAPLPAAALPADPKLLKPNEVKGFIEQVGANTGYIIHPEEILADNFVLLVQRQKELPSPEIVQGMAKILGAESAK